MPSIVYLRGSDLTEYNQELVRADLIELVLDVQERGDDIHTVFDVRYQEICDEIMEAFPKKTRAQRIFAHIEVGAMYVSVLTYCIKNDSVSNSFISVGGYNCDCNRLGIYMPFTKRKIKNTYYSLC